MTRDEATTKLAQRLPAVEDQLIACLREFDRDAGAPEGHMDLNMWCRVLAGLAHRMQIAATEVLTTVVPLLVAVESGCPDCRKRAKRRKRT